MATRSQLALFRKTTDFFKALAVSRNLLIAYGMILTMTTAWDGTGIGLKPDPEVEDLDDAQAAAKTRNTGNIFIKLFSRIGPPFQNYTTSKSLLFPRTEIPIKDEEALSVRISLNGS
jgi:hypothetical protein